MVEGQENQFDSISLWCYLLGPMHTSQMHSHGSQFSQYELSHLERSGGSPSTLLVRLHRRKSIEPFWILLGRLVLSLGRIRDALPQDLTT